MTEFYTRVVVSVAQFYDSQPVSPSLKGPDDAQGRVALHKAHLTTRSVADAPAQDRRYILWDDTLTGFGHDAMRSTW